MAELEQNIFIKKKKLFFLIIISGFFFLGFIANRWRTDLIIEKLKVEGNDLLPIEAVIKTAGIKIGNSMYEYDLKEIESKLLKIPYVKNAVVNRNLPSAIEVKITERKPIALIISDKPYYVDADNKIFAYNFNKELQNLPIISGIVFNSLKENQISSRLDSVLYLINYIKKNYEEIYNIISEVNVKDSNCFILYTMNTVLPIVFGQGNVQEKISNLNDFWENNLSFEMQKKIEYLDIRFKDQIIIRWKQQ